MAKTQVYTCDICKQSKSEEDLSRLEIRSKGLKIKTNYGQVNIDICSECLKKKGFVVEPPQTKEEELLADQKNKVTLEDKIYDFLSDMGVMFQE